MAENWEDYGKVGEDERYEKSSVLGKIFSFRTLKKLLKWLGIALLVSLYAVLFGRIFTSGPSEKMTRMLFSSADIEAYEKQGRLSVFSQEVDNFISADGGFAVYAVRLVGETDEIQLTVRYNKSTVEELRKKVAEENGEAAVSDAPFGFALVDEDGNIYSTYDSETFSKTRYKYVRVAFTVPGLFAADAVAPEIFYPSPDASSPLYIYKGVNAGEVDSSHIKTLSLYLTYDGERFGDPLPVYRASSRVERYDYKSEMPENMLVD